MMSEHVQNNIDLIHAERRFLAFQFTNKTTAYSRTVGQGTPRQFVEFPLLTDKFRSRHFVPFR